MARKAESLRLMLRHETRQLHAATDQVVLASVKQEDQWLNVVGGLASTLHTHAVALDQSSEHFGVPARSALLLQCLEADFHPAHQTENLGERTTPTIPNTWASDVTEDQSVAAAYGVGYVFEGSALGASAVLEHLAPHGLTSRYFDCLRESAPRRWSAVAARLAAAEFDETQTAVAASAAKTVFSDLLANVCESVKPTIECEGAPMPIQS